MVSTVIAVSLPVLLIEPVNYYTCKKWLLTKTADSSISFVDSRDRSIAQVAKLVNTHVMAEMLESIEKFKFILLPPGNPSQSLAVLHFKQPSINTIPSS